MLKRFFLCLLCCLTTICPALAETAAPAAPTVKAVETVLGDNRVAYPQLEGLADEEIQRAINDDIVASADISGYLVTLATLQKDGWGLNVSYESALMGDVFSVALSARGQMQNGRYGQVYTALGYDLTTGKRLTADDLFSDTDAAVAWMGEELQDTLSEELSGYLENSALSPLPKDNFFLDESGVTFYYPYSQFSYLSEYSGSCQFFYYELEDFLRWNEGDALWRAGVRPAAVENAAQSIRQQLEKGELPFLKVRIGDEMTDVVNRYRLLRDPDQYPGGKYYALEAPQFRRVLILSDALQKGYEHSQVQGLKTERMNLFGIQTGKTTQAQWRAVLGQPQSTVDVNAETAYDYGLTAGQSDYYPMGSYRLRLHADESGVLQTILLSK